jgi:hypothetical protein
MLEMQDEGRAGDRQPALTPRQILTTIGEVDPARFLVPDEPTFDAEVAARRALARASAPRMREERGWELSRLMAAADAGLALAATATTRSAGYGPREASSLSDEGENYGEEAHAEQSERTAAMAPMRRSVSMRSSQTGKCAESQSTSVDGVRDVHVEEALRLASSRAEKPQHTQSFRCNVQTSTPASPLAPPVHQKLRPARVSDLQNNEQCAGDSSF